MVRSLINVLSPNAPLFLPPKIFGCMCYILGQGSDKLDPRSIKCVFLGNSRTQKGYKCYSPTLRHCYINVNVTFDESQSYFSHSVGSDSTSLSPSLTACLLLNLLKNHSRCIVVGRKLPQRLLPHVVIHLLNLTLFQFLCVKISVLVPLILSLCLSLVTIYLHLSMLLPCP